MLLFRCLQAENQNVKKRRQSLNSTKLESPPLKYQFFRAFAYVLLFASMIACLEIGQLDNNIKGWKFFLLFGLLGLVIAVTVYKITGWISSEILDQDRRKSRDAFGCLLISLGILTPSAANYINRTYPLNKMSCRDYRVLEKSISGGRTKAYFVYVHLNGERERLQCTKPVWNRIDEKSVIGLCIRTGRLGFEFIEIKDN